METPCRNCVTQFMAHGDKGVFHLSCFEVIDNQNKKLNWYLPEFIDDLKSELKIHGNKVIVAIRDYNGDWYSPTDWEVVEIYGKKVLTII